MTDWLAEKKIKVTDQDFTWLDLSLADIARKSDDNQLPVLVIDYNGKKFVVMTQDDFFDFFGF